jgi:hypothetical protein
MVVAETGKPLPHQRIQELVSFIHQTQETNPRLLQARHSIIHELRAEVKRCTTREFKGRFLKARKNLDVNRWAVASEFQANRSSLKEGRYNHGAVPVLYLANVPETARAELQACKDDTVCGRWYNADLSGFSMVLLPFDKEESALNALLFSAERLEADAPDGESIYVVSQFVRRLVEDANGFGIEYPSVRGRRVGSITGVNLVVWGDALARLELQQVPETFEIRA